MVTVVIAATDQELALLARQGEREKASHCDFGFSFYRVRRSGLDAFVVQSGPGMANAAAATALAVERYRPARIINVGICGVYAESDRLLGRVVAGMEAVFADAGSVGSGAFLSLEAVGLPLGPGAGGVPVYNRVPLSDQGVDAESPRAVFLTLSACSGSPARAREVKGRFVPGGETLACEDMESAAVALTAYRAGVACTVLRGISNLCGERSRARWKLSEAAAAAQEAVLRHIWKNNT